MIITKLKHLWEEKGRYLRKVLFYYCSTMEPPKKSASPHISFTLLKESHLSPFSNAPRGGDHDSDWCGAEWPGFIVRHSTHFGRESDRMSILRTPECTQDVPIPNGITASQRYFFYSVVTSATKPASLPLYFNVHGANFLTDLPQIPFLSRIPKILSRKQKIFYFYFLSLSSHPEHLCG